MPHQYDAHPDIYESLKQGWFVQETEETFKRTQKLQEEYVVLV